MAFGAHPGPAYGSQCIPSTRVGVMVAVGDKSFPALGAGALGREQWGSAPTFQKQLFKM